MKRTIFATIIVIALFGIFILLINDVSDPQPPNCEAVGGVCVEQNNCNNITGELVVIVQNHCDKGICCQIKR